MKKLNFYFDFISPFSYFAWPQLSRLEGVEINYYPVPLGSLLNHWGIKGPGEVTPKREFLLKTCLRMAERLNINFTTPQTHPFNSLYALRLSLKSVAGESQQEVIDCLWRAGWSERIDMGNPDSLLNSLRLANLPADELYEKSFSKEARLELKSNLARALEFGVFGVPSFVVDNELFWGNDSLQDLQAFINGKDTLNRAKLQELLDNTSRAANQKLE